MLAFGGFREKVSKVYLNLTGI